MNTAKIAFNTEIVRLTKKALPREIRAVRDAGHNQRVGTLLMKIEFSMRTPSMHGHGS